MEFNLKKRHCFYFNETTKIPHGSYNEKELSDYIVHFAKKYHLEYKQDSMHNVIVYKSGTFGLEDSEPLMIQAHIDMVCEKNKDSHHDFDTDPLDLYVEDGWLKARGTTLGADDCIGVAYMLAILEANDLKHPPLECVFTTQEEVGLMGAMNITKEWIKSHRMISLDAGSETATIISSAGGCRCDVTRKIIIKTNDWPTYSLEVNGLLGGHSGGQIANERGNANTIAARVLQEMMLDNINIRIVKINGGLKDNAIPREAEIIFSSNTSEEKIRNSLEKTTIDLKTELEHSDPNIQVKLLNVEKAEVAANMSTSKKVINLIYLLPNGFRHRSMFIDNLTLTSLNLGIIRTQDNLITLSYSLRSALESGISNLLNIIALQAKQFGARCRISSRYPGFNYKKESNLRKIMEKVVEEKYGVKLELKAGHGGTECGIFSGLYEDFDIIGLGPQSLDIHTPDERLNLESFDRAYDLLKQIISECE